MRTTGQVLRLIGLLIEMAGVVGVVRERGGSEVPNIRIPGGPAVSLGWAAVVSGFVVWLIATLLLAATRPPRRGVASRAGAADSWLSGSPASSVAREEAEDPGKPG